MERLTSWGTKMTSSTTLLIDSNFVQHDSSCASPMKSGLQDLTSKNSKDTICSKLSVRVSKNWKAMVFSCSPMTLQMICSSALTLKRWTNSWSSMFWVNDITNPNKQFNQNLRDSEKGALHFSRRLKTSWTTISINLQSLQVEHQVQVQVQMIQTWRLYWKPSFALRFTIRSCTTSWWKLNTPRLACNWQTCAETLTFSLRTTSRKEARLGSHEWKCAFRINASSRWTYTLQFCKKQSLLLIRQKLTKSTPFRCTGIVTESSWIIVSLLWTHTMGTLRFAGQNVRPSKTEFKECSTRWERYTKNKQIKRRPKRTSEKRWNLPRRTYLHIYSWQMFESMWLSIESTRRLQLWNDFDRHFGRKKARQQSQMNLWDLLATGWTMFTKSTIVSQKIYVLESLTRVNLLNSLWQHKNCH